MQGESDGVVEKRWERTTDDDDRKLQWFVGDGGGGNSLKLYIFKEI